MLLKLEIHMKFENGEVLPIDARVRIPDRCDVSATVEYLWESNILGVVFGLMHHGTIFFLAK